MPKTAKELTQPLLSSAMMANRAAIQEKPAAQSMDSTAWVKWFNVRTLCQQKPCATTMNIGTAQAARCTHSMPACAPS
jgi:hypothetical protein